MSLFEISPELQILAKPITPGWHGVELTDIKDDITDKGVKKTIFTHKLIDGPHKGAMVWVTVIHDEKMAYNLQYLDFISGGAFLKPVKGKEKKELTLQNVKRQFDAEIKNKDVDGTTMNNIKRTRELTKKSSAAVA